MQIKRPLCLVCGIFALLVLVAVRLAPPPAEPYTGLDREEVRITGVVTNKQLRSFSGGSTVLELTVHDLSDFSVRGFSGPCPLPSGVILQIADLHNEPAIGATITAEGSLRCYQHATNPGEFDAVEYYRIQRVDFAMRSGYILGNAPPRFGLRESMYQWRRCFEIILERAFPQEEAGILKAMLLGDKTSLSEDTRKLYQTSGILHVLAISGLHISILGLMLYRLLKRLYVPAFLAAPVCLTFILLFSMLIGGGISPTRAIFMFALKILGDVLGRTYDMLTAVTLA
ncbi:MAG: ComEC family competence protein, partial [Lachnospiraceae bacterium]|nr:ComEC family competence protein [Lachnospiraceae bacterium]